MRKIDYEIYKTIHFKGRLKKIADENGIKESTLYRYALPIENNGLNIPISKLAGIMKSAGYYGILHFVAAQCQRLVVLVPRVPRSRMDENELVQHYQQTCNTATSQLIEFFKHPTKSCFNAVCQSLMDVAAESFSIQKRIENYHQLELSF